MPNFLTLDLNNPTAVNSVYFQVLSFPQFLSDKVNYNSRTGVDGFSVWLTGNRGEQFSCSTVADFQSFQAAFDEYQTAYMGLRGKRATLVYEDQDINEAIDVVVTDVQPGGSGRTRGAYKTMKTIGGLQGETTEGGIVRARWTFLGIAKRTIP